jgi:hypothetical protein
MQVRLADGTEVVLEGEPDFVMAAYDRVKADLGGGPKTVPAPDPDGEEQPVTSPENRPLQRLRDEWLDEPDSDEWGAEDLRPPAGPGEGEADQNIVWIYRCGQEMRSVYALKRKTFNRSRFARIFGFKKIAHIFVEDDRVARALRGRAKTLWREMDPETLHKMRELSGVHPVPGVQKDAESNGEPTYSEDPDTEAAAHFENEKTEESVSVAAAPGKNEGG